MIYGLLTAPLPFFATAPSISRFLTSPSHARWLFMILGSLIVVGALLCFYGPLLRSTMVAFATPAYQVMVYRVLYQGFARFLGRPPHDGAFDSSPGLHWDHLFIFTFFAFALGPPILIVWHLSPAA